MKPNAVIRKCKWNLSCNWSVCIPQSRNIKS